MENKIFKLKDKHLKSIAVSNEELWLSSKTFTSIEKLEKDTNSTNWRSSSSKIYLSRVNKLTYNNGEAEINIDYRDMMGKNQSLEIPFATLDITNEFGQYLGKKLNFIKSSKKENTFKPLLTSFLYLAVTIGATYFLATIEDSSNLTESTSLRTKRNGAFLKMIVDVLGQRGILIIGGTISIYIIYMMIMRFNNPSREIEYVRRE